MALQGSTSMRASSAIVRECNQVERNSINVGHSCTGQKETQVENHPSCDSSHLGLSEGPTTNADGRDSNTRSSSLTERTSDVGGSRRGNSPVVFQRPMSARDATGHRNRTTAKGDDSIRPNYFYWQQEALIGLFDVEDTTTQVDLGWRSWIAACDEGISRALIVNSIDDIVQHVMGSRSAYFAAVAYIDKFVAATPSPTQNFVEYQKKCAEHEASRRRVMSRYMPVLGRTTMPNPLTGPPTCWDEPSEESAARGDNDASRDVSASMLSAFLMQVIVCCCMLACKNEDCYSVGSSRLISCISKENRLTEEQFGRLQIHILETLHFDLHSVTLHQLCDTLMNLVAGDQIRDEREARRRVEILTTLHPSPSEQQQVQVERRLERAYWSIRSLRRYPGQGQLTVTQQMVSQLERFCVLSQWLCDIVIRGRRQDTTGISELEYTSSPLPVLAVAVAAVAADVLQMVLPTPLFELLPSSYQERMRAVGLEPSEESNFGSDFPLIVGDDCYALLSSLRDALRSSTSGVSHATREAFSEVSMEKAIDEVNAGYVWSWSKKCDDILLQRYRPAFAKK